MAKNKLIMILVIFGLCAPLAEADIAEKLTILSYYPSPYVSVLNLNTQTLLVYDKIQIKSGGYFRAGNTLTIDDSGITVNRDSLVEKLFIYDCGTSCWGRLRVSGNLSLADFAGSAPYIELGGVPLLRMPQLVNASTQGNLNGPDYGSYMHLPSLRDQYVIQQGDCYRNNDYLGLEACLQGVTSSAKASFQAILGACDDGSGDKCARKKGIRRLRKDGEGVFGMGIGVQLGSSHFGLGVAAIFGFGSTMTKSYRTFKYELKQ